jgi:hypothetical protein
MKPIRILRTYDGVVDVYVFPLTLSALRPGCWYVLNDEVWLYRGTAPTTPLAADDPWGLYLSPVDGRTLIYHGTCGIPIANTELHPQRIDFLNNIPDNNDDAQRPRPKSTTILKYEIFPSDSAIEKYIKTEVNRRNLDLSEIINRLNVDSTTAYNLHNSMTRAKKNGISNAYIMRWCTVLNLQPVVTFEHVPPSTVVTDFEVR